MTTTHQYRSAIAEHVRAVVAAHMRAPVGTEIDPVAFLKSVLLAVPLPTDIPERVAQKLGVELAITLLGEAGQALLDERDEMQRMYRLASAAGCPSGAAVRPFLVERGLIRIEGDKVVFLSPEGPRPTA